MAGYRGGTTFARCVVGLAVACAATTLATGCSSSNSAPHKAGAAPSGQASSTGKPDAAQALAAAPGAVLAAKTIAADETGTEGGQKVHIVADLDYSGAFKGHLDRKVTGGTPTDPQETLPYDTGTLVIGTDEYDLSGSLTDMTSAADADALVKALGGKHWVLENSDPSFDKQGAMKPWLLFGLAGEAFEDDTAKSLAALLSSGLLTADAEAGADGTFHYTATLDDTTLKTTKYDAEQQESIRDDFWTAHVGSEKIEVWLAPSGLPTEIRFIEVSSDATPSGPPDDGDTRFTWGRPVAVSAPPASDVADMTALNAAFLRLPRSQ